MRLPDGREPWTADDCVVWLWLLAHTTQASDFSFDAYIEADRRDAQLMHLARLWRSGRMVTDHTYAHNGPQGRFAIDTHRCGGDL